MQCFYDGGRIVRGPQGNLQHIVELKDASADERAIPEINCGMYCIESTWLWSHIDALSPSPVTREYYVTDLIAMALREGKPITTYALTNPLEALGINTPEQLKMAEELMRQL